MKGAIVLSFVFIGVWFVACSKSSSPSDPPINPIDSDPNESVIDSTVNGTTVSYLVSQRFRLELILQFDAGYQWDYTMSDTNAVCLDSTSYRPASGNYNQVGGAAIESFHFRAIHAGTCNLRLFEHRGWESNIAPIDTVSFVVAVS